jgi:hypothetical protein
MPAPKAEIGGNMLHFNVNWIAVILAALASMALGFGWYMALANQWMAAVGKTKEQLQPSDPTPFVWTAAMQLVMAYFLAVITPLLFKETNIYNGVLAGVHMWVGFVITTMIINHRYQGAKWSLTLIDSGYLLGVLIIQGIVIGIFG